MVYFFDRCHVSQIMTNVTFCNKLTQPAIFLCFYRRFYIFFRLIVISINWIYLIFAIFNQSQSWVHSYVRTALLQFIIDSIYLFMRIIDLNFGKLNIQIQEKTKGNFVRSNLWDQGKLFNINFDTEKKSRQFFWD